MRYEDANEQLISVFNEVLADKFPTYNYLNFKLVFDLKKRVKGGKFIIASIETTSPKIKYLTTDKTAEEGYDFILYINSKAWEFASDKDKRRIITHELRHIFVDGTDKLKLVGHEIEDFYAEIKANVDDPEWASNLSTLAMDFYDQEKDMVKG